MVPERRDELDALTWFVERGERTFFSLLPHGAAVALLRTGCEVVRWRAGSEIERPATPTRLFILMEGEVALHSPDGGRSPGKVTTGRSLELNTLLGQADSWEFRWTAQRDTRALALDWARVAEVVDASPGLWAYLKAVVLHPELRKLKNDLTLLGFLPDDLRMTMSLLRLQEGEALSGDREGERLFFVVSRGRVTVSSQPAGAQVEAGSFQTGDYFLLDGSRRLR